MNLCVSVCVYVCVCVCVFVCLCELVSVTQGQCSVSVTVCVSNR